MHNRASTCTVLSLLNWCSQPMQDVELVPKEVVQKEGPFLSAIADPLADEKLTKKLLKLAKKASKRKQTKRGVKEVVKAIRKKFKGCASVLELCEICIVL